MSKVLKIFIVLALILLSVFVKNFMFIGAAILVGSLSLLHQRFTRNFFGFELCTVMTVLVSMLYGTKMGILVGVLSISLGMIIAGNLHPTIFVSIFGFLLIGFLASFFTIDNFFVVGLGLTVLYDLLTVPIYLALGSNPATTFFYVVTHIPLNWLIFSRAAMFFS
jgi:hypothetical protein